MKELIGIFQGKQAKNNKLILNTLYNNGPLTAWGITKKIGNTEKTKPSRFKKQSLHAILTKRLHALEKKGYLLKDGKKWLLRFKGIIASLLIQENPRPWNDKWFELANEHAKFVEKYSQESNNITIQIRDRDINFGEIITKSLNPLKKFKDWIGLSTYIKELMQKGVINLDIISNQTLLTFVISEASHKQIEFFLKDLNIKK